jgi:hypothetical protein
MTCPVPSFASEAIAPRVRAVEPLLVFARSLRHGCYFWASGLPIDWDGTETAANLARRGVWLFFLFCDGFGHAKVGQCCTVA